MLCRRWAAQDPADDAFCHAALQAGRSGGSGWVLMPTLLQTELDHSSPPDEKHRQCLF